MGYDTAVIGGTMALNSFVRDFDMLGISKTQRDTVQGNIVSTFQVSVFSDELTTPICKMLVDVHFLSLFRRDVSSELS